METDLCTLEPGDSLEVAIEIFRENLFHAIPIVEEDELAGILTPIDILNLLIQEQ
jgi:acetoin utilization protein AcuB